MPFRGLRPVFVVIAACTALLPFLALASSTDGTIDSTSKYAWGSKTGWVNFGTSGGNVHVTDAALTGYAWSDTYGWINLAPSGSGVTNDAEGNLSGSAWGENLGYINFTGVTISKTGVFAGSASGTNVGSLVFDCTNCAVVTDWRPRSTRGSSGSGGGPGSGGGSAPAPLGVLINGNAVYTPDSAVALSLSTDGSITEMMISNFADFRDGVREPFRGTKVWNLCYERGAVRASCPQGLVYTVYARFWGAGGVSYGPYTDSIYYNPTPPAPTAPPVPPPTGPTTPPSFFDQLGRLIEPFIPEFLKPKPPVTPEVAIPLEAPLAFRDQWNLLPERAIHEFVFTPLPNQFADLIQKLPELRKLFADVGIARQQDLGKLYGTSLSLPGVTATALEQSLQTLAKASPEEAGALRGILLKIPGFAASDLPGTGGIVRGPLASLPTLPLADLPVEVKGNIPYEVVFAKAANERIDLGISASLSPTGSLEQRVNALAGSIVKFIVRPERPAKQVLGYLALRSVGAKTSAAFNDPGVSPARLLGSIAWSGRGVAAPETDGRLSLALGFQHLVDAMTGRTPFFAARNPDERFVLREFEYTDPDHDGIYTATVQAPLVSGEYDVYTLIDYEDPSLASHEVKLTAVVDPEGYVYEAIAGRETRIPGATVSISIFNPATNAYALWPAEDFAQQNPQTTDVRGTYAFLVPPGRYRLAAAASGYRPYESRPIEVTTGGSGVHINIELVPTSAFLRQFDWKTILLIFVTLLLVYNFYEDRARKNRLGPPARPAPPLPPLPPRPF